MPDGTPNSSAQGTAPRRRGGKPTRSQIAATHAVVEWYLAKYFGTLDDQGVPRMFTERHRVGAFAINAAEWARGRDTALFKFLVATAMFQRRQDVQVVRILAGMRASDVAEIANPRRLLALVDKGPCSLLRTNAALLERCDLSKDPATRQGCCAANPRESCHLKRHTVVLKRYGHFGKMPTSAALMLREAGASGLNALRAQALRAHDSPLDRSRYLEQQLSAAWRINSKIASMFLSALTNEDLAGPLACWKDGVDPSHFVVIDSNVDAFLTSIGYRGLGTYEARRAFVQAIAASIDLRAINPALSSYNPRLVQQAMYLFMSATNRRNIASDCMREGPASCRACPRTVARRCPVRA